MPLFGLLQGEMWKSPPIFRVYKPFFFFSTTSCLIALIMIENVGRLVLNTAWVKDVSDSALCLSLWLLVSVFSLKCSLMRHCRILKYKKYNPYWRKKKYIF